MPEPTPESAKIQSLEGLRGIMAWWVVLGHISLSFGWHLPVIDQNTLPVDVFVFLSGFVIARLIDRKKEPYAKYITRRGFRLFPLYLIVLLVSAILLPIQLEAWTNIPFATESNIRRVVIARNGTDYFLAHLAVHIPLFQSLVPKFALSSSAYAIVGQAWSISLEWQFYLLAPFFMAGATTRNRAVLVVLAVVALIGLQTFFPGGFLGTKIEHFGIGICSYLAFDRPRERMKWIAATAVFALVAIGLQGPLQIIPLAIWGTALWSAAALPRSKRHAIAATLGSRIPAHLGQISYSVYLVHMIPLYCSIYLLTKAGVSPAVMQIATLSITLIGAYILARLTFAFVEKPGIAAGARVTRRDGRLDGRTDTIDSRRHGV